MTKKKYGLMATAAGAAFAAAWWWRRRNTGNNATVDRGEVIFSNAPVI